MECEKVFYKVKIKPPNCLKTTDAFIWMASKGSDWSFHKLEMIFEHQPLHWNYIDYVKFWGFSEFISTLLV